MSTELQQQARLFFGSCRGGTTATFNAWSQHSQSYGVLHPMKNGLKMGHKTDGFYTEEHGTTPYRVAKESIGYSTFQMCTMDLFPAHINGDIFTNMRPVAIFREPTAVWNSWFKKSWGRIELLVTAYNHLYVQAMKATRLYGGRILTYETLTQNQLLLPQWIDYWGMPQENLVEWDGEAGSQGNWGADFMRHVESGKHDSLLATTQFSYHPPKYIISDADQSQVRSDLSWIYELAQEMEKEHWQI